MKKSTIHDIARELNITASTVSRALNDNPRISEATRLAVHEMARKLNYQHNQIAAALRIGRTHTVGVLVPTADRSFFAKVVRGIEEEVYRAGYHVIICQSNDQLKAEKANIDTLLRLRVDGIIASIAKETQSYEHFFQLKARRIPLILFDRISDTLNVNQVVIDDFNGAYRATEHLICQGCRRIAHFSGPQHINIYRERLRGYSQALKDYGLSFDVSLICYFKDLLMEDGAMGMQHLLALTQPPDAVFSASDNAALGAMQMLKKRHIHIPQEVAIIGFANEPFTAFVDPSLSSVDQHSLQMGTAAAQLFLDEINQPGQEPYQVRRITLNPEIVVRKSSLKLE